MHASETTPTPRAWWRTRRGALVALNAGLLATLAGVLHGPEAIAQVAGATGRAPGEYTLVGGAMPGTTDNTIFVLDAANRELIALEWSQSRSRLEGIGFRDLAEDVRGRTSR
ncbi:MAG: hypothetical protein ACF8Q5_12830 [Phycisphaerales bacterium JB040]